MKTRKRTVVKNIAQPQHRPGRQFIDVIKSVMTTSQPVLEAHKWLYRTAITHFDLLSQAFNETEKLMLDAETTRPLFQRDEKLANIHQHAKDQCVQAAQTLSGLESGEAKRNLDSEASRILASLHITEREALRKEYANDIDLFRRLRLADARLSELRLNLKSIKTVACLPSSKYRRALGQIHMQEKVVTDLEAALNQKHEHPEVKALQQQYDDAVSKVKHHADHFADLHKDATEKMDAAHVTLQQAEETVNRAQTQHYSNLDTTLMHAVVKLYERFNAYKLSFDNAVADKITNKNEVAPYQQKLNASKARLDQLMEQLWCDKFGQMNAKNIHEQFSRVSQGNKDKLLAQQPDSAALDQVMGVPNVSANSMFKKPVATETLEKRKHLVRTQGMVNNRVVYKL